MSSLNLILILHLKLLYDSHVFFIPVFKHLRLTFLSGNSSSSVAHKSFSPLYMISQHGGTLLFVIVR